MANTIFLRTVQQILRAARFHFVDGVQDEIFIEITILMLQFIKNLCEGHNNEAQLFVQN